MNETTNEELEINLSELFQIVKKKFKFIIIATLICLILSLVATMFLMDKKYQSTARILPKPEVNEGLVDYTQINANNSMANNYVELIKGSNVLDQVNESLGLDEGFANKVISVSRGTDNQIITVSATTTDPELSKQIVDETLKIFYVELKEQLEISNVATIDKAKIPTSPVSPSLKMNLAIGVALGIFISCGIIFIQFMLDTRIHNKEEAEKYLGIPVLGVVPDFEK